MDVPDLVGDEKDATAAPTMPSSSTNLKLDLLANHLKVKLNDTVTETKDEVRIEEEEDDEARSASSTRTVKRTEIPPPPSHRHVESTERFRKIELLRLFQELEQRGIRLSGSYSMTSSLDEMEQEYEIVKSLQTKRQAVKLYKGFMMNAVHAIEFLNETYNPFDFQLHGWSEHVSLGVDDYDDVFAEIYEKYKHTGRKMEPELKLALMLVMSAATFHAKNTMLGSFSASASKKNAQPSNMKGPDPRAFLDRLRKQQPPPPPQSTVIVEEEEDELSTTSSSTPAVTTSRRRKKPMTINI